MELIEAKVTAIISLALGSLFAGFLPVFLAKCSRHRRPLFLSAMLCFGAGVLLSTSLVHMLPEFRKSMPKYKEYAELIYCTGFFIVYSIDEIVHLIYGNGPLNNRNAESQSDHFPSQNFSENSISNTYGSIENRPLLYERRQQPYNPDFFGPMENDLIYDQRPVLRRHHVDYHESYVTLQTGMFGLLVALSIHAVLEGLAVGLEKSSSQVLLMLGAIASHKLVVGFCLGTELSSPEKINYCLYFASIITFSFGSALGIGIGMIITKIPKNVSKIILPVLQGLAGGTLLYVTVCEVLPRERTKWHQRHTPNYAGAIQFISVALGFSAMTVITKYLSE